MKKRFYIASCALVIAISLMTSLVSFGTATEGSSPIAENLEFVTYRDVSLGGTLTAYDPDGDLLTFEITTDPTKGKIELQKNGKFVYTPEAGKKGRDYFGYKAFDSQGNYSQEATVIIKIMKQKTKVTYSDLNGNAAEYAAIALAENGVYVGECLAGSYVFNADELITRGDFLAMCMKASGRDILSGVSSTGFSDDSDISQLLKPYVATALMSSIVNGYSVEGAAAFSPSSPVSYSEAAVMLNNSMKITNVIGTAAMAVFNDTTVPSWAYQATSNLAACNLMPVGIDSMSGGLTKGEAAIMLVNAMSVMENR